MVPRSTFQPCRFESSPGSPFSSISHCPRVAISTIVMCLYVLSPLDVFSRSFYLSVSIDFASDDLSNLLSPHQPQHGTRPVPIRRTHDRRHDLDSCHHCPTCCYDMHTYLAPGLHSDRCWTILAILKKDAREPMSQSAVEVVIDFVFLVRSSRFPRCFPQNSQSDLLNSLGCVCLTLGRGWAKNWHRC